MKKSIVRLLGAASVGVLLPMGAEGKASTTVQKSTTVTTTPAEDVKTVKGKVIDENGDPVIGANIFVKGTTNGTATDIDGTFSITTYKNDVLEVKFIGYNTKEVVPKGKEVIVKLDPNDNFMQEVVVLGYGANSRKQDLSASGVLSRTWMS